MKNGGKNKSVAFIKVGSLT